MATQALPTRERMTRRDERWVLRRCAARGHVLAHVDDSGLRDQLGPLPGPGPGAGLLRCLRCGTWVLGDDVAVEELLGSTGDPIPLAQVPLPVRGAHGRRFALLRLLAVERAVRGTALILGGLVAYHVASERGSLLATLERWIVAGRPLADQFGVNLAESRLVLELEHLLGGSGAAFRVAALVMLTYGCLQIVEGIGLWGGWRWAEYLATIATVAFIPLEVYELVHRPTVLRTAALLVNVALVAYLVYKGRLFGVRGGHARFLVEIRDTTLPADLLRLQGRSPEELRSTRVV